MASSITIGDLVDGKYRIIRLIGEGGWGIVFEGENIRTLKRVAIKILRPHSGLTREIITRFEREAQAAGRIGSEHIVEVYDLGSLPDATHYMVMELLTGQELSTRLRTGGPMPPVTVAKIVLQLLDGLKGAHEAGILHRDLKPENLFLVRTRSGDDFVKILDFGISKFNQNTPGASATMTGAVLGSPCYMAPEQARGLKAVDVRTDLYAVGTLMFESLTGRVPFEGDNFNDLMFRIVLAPRPDPRELRPDLEPGMAMLVVKAMAIDPKLRFQSAEEMSAALVEWLATQGVNSIRVPELKRGATPRTSQGPSQHGPSQTPDILPPRTPAPGPGLTPAGQPTTREPHAVSGGNARDGTSSDGAGTPLAASSSRGRTRNQAAGSRKALVVVLAVLVTTGAVALFVAGGAWIGRGRQPVPSATPISQAQTPPAVVPSVPEPAKLAPEPLESAVPAPPSTQAENSSSTSALSHHGNAGVTPRSAGAAQVPSKPGAAAASSPVPESTAGAPAATPAPSAPAPAKPGNTIEGREIRTGL